LFLPGTTWGGAADGEEGYVAGKFRAIS